MKFLKNFFSRKTEDNLESPQKNDEESQTNDNASMLFDVLWAFYEKEYKSKEEFSNEVKQYQIDINEKDTWKPDEIVFDKPEITLLLEMGWEEPPHDKVEFTLKSENNKNFTALDLMFQINNFLAQYDLSDHHFFEGLHKDSENNRYMIHLGS